MNISAAGNNDCSAAARALAVRASNSLIVSGMILRNLSREISRKAETGKSHPHQLIMISASLELEAERLEELARAAGQFAGDRPDSTTGFARINQDALDSL